MPGTVEYPAHLLISPLAALRYGVISLLALVFATEWILLTDGRIVFGNSLPKNTR